MGMVAAGAQQLPSSLLSRGRAGPRFNNGTELNFSVEHKNIFGLTGTFLVENLLDSDIVLDRTIYQGPRHVSPVLFFERPPPQERPGRDPEVEGRILTGHSGMHFLSARRRSPAAGCHSRRCLWRCLGVVEHTRDFSQAKRCAQAVDFCGACAYWRAFPCSVIGKTSAGGCPFESKGCRLNRLS